MSSSSANDAATQRAAAEPSALDGEEPKTLDEIEGTPVSDQLAAKAEARTPRGDAAANDKASSVASRSSRASSAASRRSAGDDQRLSRQLRQEITAMRRCGRHPNVVALLDAFWISPDRDNPHGEAALVMEVATGGGLFERLVEDGAYSEEYAAKILQQIAVALYHIHSRGILHRDIKPEVCTLRTLARAATRSMPTPS